MDLDGRQIQFLYNVRILDLARLLDRLPLQPLGREARAGDGGSTAEGLKFRIHDRAVLYFDLQFHDIAALWSSDDSRAHARLVLLEASHVAWVVEMVHHFVAVCHVLALL